MKQNLTKTKGYDFIKQKYPDDKLIYFTDLPDLNEENVQVVIPTMKWLFCCLHTIIEYNDTFKKVLPDLIVVAGGKNTRFNDGKIPKLLASINSSETVLDNIIKKSKNRINNLYIITTTRYINDYINAKHNMCIIVDIGDNTHNFVQTLHLGLNKIIKNYDSKLRSTVLFMWSDCLLLNGNIISELNMHTTCSSVFNIPVAFETNPYAYIITENNRTVKDVQYRSNVAIDYALHDMSIFSINRYIFREIALRSNSCEETLSKLVQIIKECGLNTEFYITNYKTSSFNTNDELLDVRRSLYV